MIEISLTAALALYSGVIGIGALILWFYTEATTQHAHKVLEKQNLWRCTFCAFVYLDEEAGNVSQCPRCQSLNTATDKGARYVAVAEAPHSNRDAIGPEEPPRRNPSRGKRPGARSRGPRRRGGRR